MSVDGSSIIRTNNVRTINFGQLFLLLTLLVTLGSTHEEQRQGRVVGVWKQCVEKVEEVQ